MTFLLSRARKTSDIKGNSTKKWLLCRLAIFFLRQRFVAGRLGSARVVIVVLVAIVVIVGVVDGVVELGPINDNL